MRKLNSLKKKRGLKNSNPFWNRRFNRTQLSIEMIIILTTTTYKDFIPEPNEQFDDWQKKYVDKITAKLADWGIASGPGTEYQELLDEQVLWDAAWAAGKPLASPERTKSLTKAMQDERKIYEKMCRDFNQSSLAHNKKVTAADKVALGTTVPDETKTYQEVPDYGPVGDVKKVKPGVHEIFFTDPEHPDTKALPLGADEIYVYRAVTDQGAPEQDVAAFDQIDSVSEDKYIAHFEDSQKGKKAWYFGRYKDAKKKLSPPGDKFGQTII